MTRLAIVIPTYKRAHLLKLLLEDVAQQTTIPFLIIVIDGDPKSDDVPRLLHAFSKGALSSTTRVEYVPSNHANLAYQRYLGRRVSQDLNSSVLLYLDDDLRIPDHHSICRLVEPLQNGEHSVVGCTGSIVYPENRENDAVAAVRDRAAAGKSGTSMLVRLLGSARGMAPGSLSPSGHRCVPKVAASGTFEVQWLRGGVMACRMDSLTEDCFSEDLFALSELGYGHGEDTLLSRRLGSKGRLLFVSAATFLHPCTDAPKAYATRAFKMGYGIAYSRRLLNDNYRWPAPPTGADRAALFKSYVGNVALCWTRALRQPLAHRLGYAWGYMLGAVKGIFRPPSSSRLTPDIHWQRDAEEALKQSPT